MTKRTATIILNRNLPQVADQLYEALERSSSRYTDIYIVEAGTDGDKLSRHCAWWADWEDATKYGLRTPRGFNYGLCQLWKEGKFKNYDFFFLLTNDTEFNGAPVIEILSEEMDNHTRVGILSPCSKRWGEAQLLGPGRTKYFWYVQNVALMMRRSFVESVMHVDDPNYMNFLYDGNNFRGYCADLELVIKGYANDWATAITTKLYAEENEAYLRTKADLIKTDSFEENIRKYVNEGRTWMRNKYGFNSHWMMQKYAKFMYETFFEYYSDLKTYSI
ncbi:MAG TPA: hypothetical protein PKB02_00935 [Anaerohalosphaeraceae bacterium]|nr:hypothetical protein [Anaerohalosphaeraceae bacterium]